MPPRIGLWQKVENHIKVRNKRKRRNLNCKKKLIKGKTYKKEKHDKLDKVKAIKNKRKTRQCHPSP